ncbi:hypothetical protein [Pseudodesulfovibrio sediminis]|uniref:Zinc-ribbon 15 domain-containing protein n=1 Tax=Pseudodesulfovibrio sediminis TaxID=2810563 RepID=A0ABN6ETZ8_9BACT|nr:hypothetical protein [Pseudodesulfovibrio sediminis]BCS88655.1 hypothetical protein PSDVSF_18970 [Pseudodesulfovibrio sediminis]
MFIIYGIRSKEHPVQYTHNVYCDNCGHTNHTAQAFTKYAHLFWIPFFITSRPILLTCDNCDHIMDKRELSKEDKKRVNQAFFTPLNTLPFFLGVGLLLLAAFLYHLDNQEIRQKELAMLDQPQVNDIYIADYSKLFNGIDFEGYNFGALKITSLQEDGISFAVSITSYRSDYGVERKLREGFPDPDSFVDDEILIPYDDVRKLYNSGTFSGIHREKADNP